MIRSLEFWGAVLNFLGGAILSWDILTTKRIKTRIGAQHLQKIFQQVGLGDKLTDDEGKPLTDEDQLLLWHASRSLGWARAGFIMMTLGFLLEILSLWIKYPSG